MNKHREKCDHLKEIRKSMADELGIELNQTVCTYEGDCKGTCPKCQQEEQKLSKALLKGTAVAASTAVLLTGCSLGPYATEGAIEAPVYTQELSGDVAIPPDDYEDLELLMGEIVPSEEETKEFGEEIIMPELEGDVAYIEEDSE